MANLDPTRPQDVQFTPVSTDLIKVRLVGAAIWTLIPAIACVVIAVVGGAGDDMEALVLLYVAAAVFVALFVWMLWLIPRQVRAIGWSETADEFLIRRGIMFKSLTVIPFGRIQYVDVSEGPIARHYGIAGIEIHTASQETSGKLEGLPAEDAAALRDRLAQRGRAELAGL